LFKCSRTHTHTRTHARTHTLTHIHTHARTHARTHTHIHIHIHIHTQNTHTLSLSLSGQVREHVLGFGIVKDPASATAYQCAAQGHENAERGIPGDVYPFSPTPPVKPGGTATKKGGAKLPVPLVLPPGRAGWPYEAVPCPESFHGCDVQVWVSFRK